MTTHAPSSEKSEATTQRPTIGRVLHYFASKDSHALPAIVTKVDDQAQTCEVVLLGGDNAATIVRGLKIGDDAGVPRLTWPARV